MFKEVGSKRTFRRIAPILYLRGLFGRGAPNELGVFMFGSGKLSLLAGRSVENGYRLSAVLMPSQATPDTYRTLIRQLLDKSPKISRECIAMIPEEELHYRIISLPKERDIKEAIEELMPALPFEAGDAVYAYEEIRPLAGSITHSDYGLWVASKKYLESYRNILESGDLSVRDFFPETRGIIEVLFAEKETMDANLILTVSETRSVFSIFAGRAIHFSGVLPFGTASLSAPGEEADRFIAEVAQATAFYKNRVLHEHGAQHHINRILLIGELPKYLSDRIALHSQIRVETPDIWAGIFAADAQTSEIISRKPAELVPLLGAIKHYERA